MLITVTNSKYSNQNQQYMSCININIDNILRSDMQADQER